MYSQFSEMVPCFHLILHSPAAGVFEELLSLHLPSLHHQLLKLQVLTVISLSWFLTVYLSVVPYSSAVVLLDLFFLHGTKV